jgi:hypothetical protein
MKKQNIYLPENIKIKENIAKYVLYSKPNYIKPLADKISNLKAPEKINGKS